MVILQITRAKLMPMPLIPVREKATGLFPGRSTLEIRTICLNSSAILYVVLRMSALNLTVYDSYGSPIRCSLGLGRLVKKEVIYKGFGF